jgi:hypothetical protein
VIAENGSTWGWGVDGDVGDEFFALKLFGIWD